MIERRDVERGFAFKQSKELASLVNVCQLVDGHHLVNPGQVEYTFSRPNFSGSRLDRFYLTADLSPKLLAIQYITTLSDHRGVLADLLPAHSVDRGMEEGRKKREERKGGWKLNLSILKNQHIVNKVRDYLGSVDVDQRDMAEV